MAAPGWAGGCWTTVGKTDKEQGQQIAHFHATQLLLSHGECRFKMLFKICFLCGKTSNGSLLCLEADYSRIISSEFLGDLALLLLDFPLNLAALTEKSSVCLVSRVFFPKTVLLFKSRFSST